MSDHHNHDEHREGLGHDLPQMQDKGMVRRPVGRRGLLGVFGGIGAATLVACGTDGDTATITSSSSTSGAEGGPGLAGGMGAPPRGGPGGGGAGMDVSQEGLDDGDIPEETGGPYPGDGSNGVNVLTESGIVREDLRSSFGDASGVAEGYDASVDNLAQVSLDSDGIFSDGYSLQLATLTGSVDGGYTLKLNVPV